MNAHEIYTIARIAHLFMSGYTREQAVDEIVEDCESYDQASGLVMAAVRMFGRVFENASA